MKKCLITKLFLIVLVQHLFSCCTKEVYRTENEQLEDELPVELSAEERAFRNFAIILSEAVYNESALRSFLKKEALKQIDNDYDVFYPWTKNQVVDGHNSFKEILMKYDSDGLLETIDTELPLLTIYIPDWSWLDPHCFSVTKWDTSDCEVAVSYRTTKATKPLFGKGKLLGTIPSGNFLDHPVLIVKNNERIGVTSPRTKGTESDYYFIDSAYDGTIKLTKGYTEQEKTFSTTPAIPRFLRPTITPKVIDAYEESLNSTGLTQRDYIFYDMTSSVDTGVVNVNYVERLYAFKLNPSSSAWYDEASVNVGYHDATLLYEDSPGVEYTDNQIKAMEWDEGKLELVFYVRAADYSVEKHTSVNIGDAFVPSLVYYKYYTNIFGTVTWRSYYTYSQYLVSKWVTANHNLFTWNLKYLPYIITVAIEEKDSGTTYTRNITKTYQYVTNVNLSLSGQDVKNGYGTGMTDTETESESNTESYVQGSDSLGSFLVQFGDPIITNSYNAGASFSFNMYQTGDVDVVIMPRLVSQTNDGELDETM